MQRDLSGENMADLYYEDVGQGEPIVLLHAFPLDGRMWLAQKDELARRARVIIPDQRGFGRSAHLPAAKGIDDYARDVLALLDRLGLGRATIAGLSMGGYVALGLARLHPERIARLALADTRSLPDGPEVKAARDQNIELVRTAGALALVERMIPKLLSSQASADMVARVKSLGASQKTGAVTDALAAMRDRPDSTPLLASIDVPSAVIVGSLDSIAPPAEASAMALQLRRAELEIIEGAGHLANLEAPAAFTAALSRLMARR